MPETAPSPETFLGLDIGTSSIKAVLVDAQQRLLGEASAALTLSRPQPLWSEQDPRALGRRRPSMPSRG